MLDLESFTVPFDRASPFHPPGDYAQLRRRCPVARTTTAAGTEALLVIGAEAAQQVLSDRRFVVNPPGVPVEPDALMTDGDEHARLRREISRGLGARTMSYLQPRFEAITRRYVSDVVAAGPGVDLVATLTRPLTLGLISELLGVDSSDRERFYRWAEAISLIITDFEKYAEVWGGLIGFLEELTAEKRRSPGKGLISELVRTADADRLTDRQMVYAAAALLSGGQLTTANALAIGLIKLLSVGGLGRYRDDPAAVELAVEEVLRHQAGISGEAFPRWAAEDVELHGQTIRAGEMVIVRLEGANRDPDRFTDPDAFDPTRSPNHHMRFGHGPHRCIGAAAARMELVVALTVLAEQLPDLALVEAAEDIPWTDNELDSGPARLLVTW